MSRKHSNSTRTRITKPIAAIVAEETAVNNQLGLGSWAPVRDYARALWRIPGLRKTWLWFAGPALLYAAIFFLMQPHYFGHFASGFYLDNGDGFQNVWNIWWVDHALTGEHINPYYTTMLHWPHGTSLLPQTMNIFNGLVGIPLMHVFGASLVGAVNFAVLFGFIFGGVTMFWFIQKLYGTYWVSLFTGGLFTFSSYHFAHAQGHLQLVSLEFIPLFLLAFWTLLERLRYRYALMAAGALFLVLLCDYYYFFWCGIVAGLWLGWQLWQRKVTVTKQNCKVLGVFAAAALALCGPLVIGLLRLNKHDPLTGFHDPGFFSMDPLTIFFPGGSWYWHTLTDSYTAHLPYLAESSIFFGYGLLLLLLVAFIRLVRRDRVTPDGSGFWWLVMALFAILALGPRLHMLNRTLDSVPLPYDLLMRVFPTLQISGMPIRWILIALIAAIVVGAGVLARINFRKWPGRLAIAAVIIISLIDLWPRALPLMSPTYRPYVYHLRQLPYGAVIDDGAMSNAEQLYNQTLHHKPLAFGYVTRLPKSVDEKDFHIFADLAQGRTGNLCRIHHIRYLTRPASRPLTGTTFPAIYNDGNVIIYDLKNSPHC